MGWMVKTTLWPPYTQEKDPMLIVQKAGWAPRLVWAGAENLTSCGIRSLDRPSRSESLYRLSCPDPHAGTVTFAVRDIALSYANATHLAECSTNLLENR
jgi:hypothetical protein